MTETTISDLSIEIICSISEHLSQTDVINLNMTHPQFSQIYPKHVKKTFKKTDTVQEYTLFLNVIAKYDCIESLHVAVNPLLWHKLAPGILKGRRFRRVCILPLHINMINRPCWIPECDTCISGFLGEHTMTLASLKRNFMELTNYGDGIEELPYMIRAHHIDSVILDGHFSRLERIPQGILQVSFRNAHLTMDDMRRISRYPILDFTRCTLDENCADSRLECELLYIRLEDLRYIKHLPFCSELAIDVCGPLPRIDHVYAQGMELHVRGSTTASADHVHEYFSELFPTTEYFDYNSLVHLPM